MTQSDNGLIATVETRDGQQEIRARWLIGADGARSGARRALNLKLDGATYPEWFVATNVMFDFMKHGYGQSNVVLDPEHWAIIPIIDQTGLWRCTYREEGTLSDAEVRALVPDRYSLFAPGLAETKPAAVSPYRVHDRCAETLSRGTRSARGRRRASGESDWRAGPTGGLLDAFPLSEALDRGHRRS